MEVSVVGGGMLFSAYAEVFPIEKTLVESDLAFLCLRRGVSASTVTIRAARPFSLPTQRCFYLKRHHPEKARLFSAYAEVFPRRCTPPPRVLTFLCLRRGVSEAGAFYATDVAFSLPTQRCF